MRPLLNRWYVSSGFRTLVPVVTLMGFLAVFMAIATALTKTITPDGTSHPRNAEGLAFKQGELLVFRALYYSRLTGNVPAGDVSFEIRPETVVVEGQECMHVVGQAHTRGVFNFFYKVENIYETFISKEALAPVRFSRNIREGRYRREDNVVFDHQSGRAASERDTITTGPYIQDVLSIFYYFRTFDMDTLSPGEYFMVDFYLRDSVYVSRVMFEGREQVTTSLGTFNTMRFIPEMQKGTTFEQRYPMTLWLSDDRNRIPVRMESGMVVGNARFDLEGFRGLRHDLDSFVPQP